MADDPAGGRQASGSPGRGASIDPRLKDMPEDLDEEGDRFVDCDYCEQMDAYLLAADSLVGHVLTQTGCLFYARYVEKHIPHLHQDPAGCRMDVDYLACLDHTPYYHNLFNDRRVRERFGIPTHDPVLGAKDLTTNNVNPWMPHSEREARLRTLRCWTAQRSMRRDLCDREWTFDADRRLLRTCWSMYDRNDDQTNYRQDGRCRRCNRNCYHCYPTPYGSVGPDYQDPDTFDWVQYLASEHGMAEEYKRQGLRFPESLRLPPGVMELVEARWAAKAALAAASAASASSIVDPLPEPTTAWGGTYRDDRGPVGVPAADAAGGPQRFNIGDSSSSAGSSSVPGTVDSVSGERVSNMFSNKQES